MTKPDRPPKPRLPDEPIDAVAESFRKFIHTETAGGVVLLLAAVLALALANTPFGPAYEAFWGTPVGMRFGGFDWIYPLRHWINDGLMTLFFFVVGLEVKREMVAGELSEPRAAVLPLAAALGGMVVPAAIYLALASGPGSAAGWGVVMATDIAFVVGCLALLGNRVPVSLRVFVLALAIMDDIGAILVIALGYSHGFHFVPFALALAGVGIVALMRWLGVRRIPVYWVAGMLIWAGMHESGIHPTIAGVALGLLTPDRPWVDKDRLENFLKWARAHVAKKDEGQAADHGKGLGRVSRAVQESVSPLERLEGGLHPWTAFAVMPLFALANAGVAITPSAIFEPIAIAVAVGLMVGKPLGIVFFAWLAVRLRFADKAKDMTWPLVAAAGILAGIGFTMALFIGNLAFDGLALQSAKFGILAGSLVAGIAGTALLAVLTSKGK